MGNLLTFGYWFNPRPGPWMPEVMKAVYIIFVVMFFLGLMVSIFRGRFKDDVVYFKFWGKLQGMFITIGIAGVVLVAAREQMINIIGMPFLLLLNVIGAIVWIVFIVRYATVTMPKRRAEQREKKEKEKYLK